MLAADVAEPAADAEGTDLGDPACWLHRTCPDCGRLRDEAERDRPTCPRCGAPSEEGSAPREHDEDDERHAPRGA